ncbi:MAG: M43 family zinc metalloprotease, partial [Chitinophagales bacterium]|nr:M43 family zinc metalloprotease [Chitinophagales bacterium]
IIPVVVHVLYNLFEDSLSDAQIHSQIEALNRDFSMMNEEVKKLPEEFAAVAAPTKIRFALARRTPEGQPTNGVVRKFTPRISFSDKNDMKFSKKGGDDAWDPSQYLNIWVCRLQNNILGYAQMPGGPKETDGVVINTSAFGTCGTARAPYNLGRTATHEIGHWLNLIHIWGDKEDCTGDDKVEDTPPQGGPNYGIPRQQPSSCGFNSMYMNFMDYTDDAAMAIFTAGQVRRMQMLFEPGGYRHGLLFSKGLLDAEVNPLPENIVTQNSCLQINNSSLKNAYAVEPNHPVYHSITEKDRSNWYVFYNTRSENNFLITLHHLQIDLDISVYDEEGVLLGRSQSAGNNNEIIVLNNARPGNYYIKVYRYQGATSNSCYELHLQQNIKPYEIENLDKSFAHNPKTLTEQTLQYKLYPNPAIHAVNVEFYSDEENEFTISLTDITGKTVKQKAYIAQAGLNGLFLELDDLQSGIYQLTAYNQEYWFRQTLLINK